MNFENRVPSQAAPRGADGSVPVLIGAPGLGTRRMVLFGLVAMTTLAGTLAMGMVLLAAGTGVAGWLVVPLFAATFAWISMSFWTAAIGFVLGLLRLDPLSLQHMDREAPAESAKLLASRTALVVPIYNEDVERVVLGLEATCLSVLETGQGGCFELYLLSDSDDAHVIRNEEHAFLRLRQRLAGRLRVHYRRRHENRGRKAGNIADFCRRWGSGYEFMVVLDADSVMEGEALVRLVRCMEANPDVGLIQTLPVIVRQDSLFGRFQQFAHALHGPMLGAGQAFWQGDTANYWGHNAILRVRPFIEHCDLPMLPGRPPIGGEILSHDFVEAAFLRRAGWAVWLQPGIGGSYEELPANLIDYAKRDRRWSQGNLQHLRLLNAPGLHPLSRLHFLFGGLAYLSSLFWLLMLAAATVTAVGVSMGLASSPVTASALRSPLAYGLLAGTLCLLLIPRMLGIGLALLQRNRDFGGRAALLVSGVLETLYSILLAPLMMVFHSLFIAAVMVGRDVKWTAQPRFGRMPSWQETWKRTGGLVAFGGVWGALVLFLAPGFFGWILPVLAGVMLAPVLVRSSGSHAVAFALRRWGCLQTPTELRPPQVLRTLAALEQAGENRFPSCETPINLARWAMEHNRIEVVGPYSELPNLHRATG